MSNCLSIHAESESSRARMQARATPPVPIQGRSAGVEQPELDGSGRYQRRVLVVFSSLQPAEEAGRSQTDREARSRDAIFGIVLNRIVPYLERLFSKTNASNAGAKTDPRKASKEPKRPDRRLRVVSGGAGSRRYSYCMVLVG